MSDNVHNKSLACKHCGKVLASKASLSNHIRTHTRDQLFECGVCGKKCTQKGNLNLHMRIHTGNKPHTCQICKKSFHFRSNFANHMRTHTGEKQYSCEICRRKFARGDQLKKHKGTHSVGQSFLCHTCQKSYKSKYTLNMHIKYHTGELHYNCKICHKKFPSQNYLTDHEKIHGKCHTCQTCERTFATASALRSHVYTHMTGKPYMCNLCGNKHNTERDLIGHLKIHQEEKPYKCEICRKEFTFSTNFYKHNMSHSDTGIREDPYICNECEMEFPSKTYLEKHMQNHIEHPCKICGEIYSSKRDLSIHQLIHKGDKGFLCDICGKQYGSFGCFSQHVATHTNGYKIFPRDLRNVNASMKTKLKQKRAHKKESMLNQAVQTNESDSELNRKQDSELKREHDSDLKGEHEVEHQRLDDSKLKRKHDSELKKEHKGKTSKHHLQTRKHDPLNEMQIGKRSFKQRRCKKSSPKENKNKSFVPGSALEFPKKKKERRSKCKYCGKYYATDYLLFQHNISHAVVILNKMTKGENRECVPKSKNKYGSNCHSTATQENSNTGDSAEITTHEYLCMGNKFSNQGIQPSFPITFFQCSKCTCIGKVIYKRDLPFPDGSGEVEEPLREVPVDAQDVHSLESHANTEVGSNSASIGCAACEKIFTCHSQYENHECVTATHIKLEDECDIKEEAIDVSEAENVHSIDIEDWLMS